MKSHLVTFITLAIAASALAADGPLRVLYYDATGQEQTKGGPLHPAMAALGRDGIFFDYVAGADLTPDLAARYSIVYSAADAVPGIKDAKLLPVIGGEPVEKLRERIVGAARSLGMEAGWQAFLLQREPEVREVNPNVANYERRPEPLTFQKPFNAKGSMERTQVPADLKLELFASAPDIRKPIAMAWDERGRCWVAETSDYPHGINPEGRGNDTIRICEDTDGDGRADKFTVFADKLNIPTAIVFANGGIIVSQPPRLMFLKDTDGDDKADVREDIMMGWGIGDTHAQASSLHFGYDNWLYGAVGYSGFKGTVGGKAYSFSMGSYRFKADGSALEFLHQFNNNTWGHSYNAAGDQFGGTANGAPIFYGGIPKTIVPESMRTMTAKKINVVDTVHAITPNFRQVDVFNGYTAAAGSSFIFSKSLPARFQGCAMVCEPTMKVITLMKVQPVGAGYTAKDAYNLVASTDEWMSPVFAEVGPDGAVWFADWQNFIIQHNPTPSPERGGYKATTGPGGAHVNDLRDHERGRIYRIVSADASKRAMPKLTNTGELVAALENDVQYTRLNAQRLLVEGKKTEAAEALKKMVLAKNDNVGAIHALWTLQGLSLLDEATHRAALLAKSAELRRNAIRALSTDGKAQSLFFGAGVVTDPDLTTRLAAFVKLAEFPSTSEIKTLVASLGTDVKVKTDEWLWEAIKLLEKKHGAQAYKLGPNLLANAGFEELDDKGLPSGWARRDYGKPPGNATAEWKIVSGEGNVHSGKNALCCITREGADTSFFANVPLKPNTDYRLAGWIKTHGFKGKASLNDHLGRAETDKVLRNNGWTEVEVIFNSKTLPKASINVLHVAKGDAYFDDVSLCELLPAQEPADQKVLGDVKRGEEIFWKHPVAACMNCHMLGGKGSAVGPALDGIASRKDEAYLIQSLLDPNAKLAESYTATPISPMPPMGLILKPQELADVQAFVLSLKDPHAAASK